MPLTRVSSNAKIAVGVLACMLLVGIGQILIVVGAARESKTLFVVGAVTIPISMAVTTIAAWITPGKKIPLVTRITLIPITLALIGAFVWATLTLPT